MLLLFFHKLWYTKNNKRRATNVQLALGSSQELQKLKLPNVWGPQNLYSLGIFVSYKSNE